MKHYAFGLLTLLAAEVLCGCNRSQAPAPSSPPLAVQVVKSKPGAITRSVTLPGEVKAYQQATLYAKVAGYLKTITVDKGDQVTEGKLLAEIEVPELIAERSRYRAEVEVAAIDYKRLSESQQKVP